MPEGGGELCLLTRARILAAPKVDRERTHRTDLERKKKNK